MCAHDLCPLGASMHRLLLFFLVLSLLFACARPAAARDTTFVYYAGPEGGVRQALGLTGDTDTFVVVADPAQADVFLLNGVIPDPELISARVQAGAGAVLILGPQINDVDAVLGKMSLDAVRTDPLSLTTAKGAADPLLD